LSARVELVWLPHGLGLDLPHYQTPGSAGCDLQAAVSQDRSIEPSGRALIPCGFAMALEAGWEAQVRPRSGLALRHGVTVLNAPGTIDADYRGEVCVVLINHGPDAFVVTRGMRVAQMVIAPAPQARFGEVDTLDATQRGAGGFGSTG
jgi:dUTP pyrophosphatase